MVIVVLFLLRQWFIVEKIISKTGHAWYILFLDVLSRE